MEVVDCQYEMILEVNCPFFKAVFSLKLIENLVERRAV